MLRLRDQGQLDRVEVVVARAALGELELQVDGGEGLVGDGGVEGLERVDADLLVGNRDAAFGRGAEDGEISGRRGEGRLAWIDGDGVSGMARWVWRHTES